MQVSIHGSLHKELGIKNQDACRKIVSSDNTKIVYIVCDGCTNIDAQDPKTFLKTHSEVGAGLFCSLYETLENPFDVENFPQSAEKIIAKMLSLIDFDKEKIKENQKLVDYIVSNYCFTILACFETEKEFVVYTLGDGFIIVINHFDAVTYLELKKGKYSPYIVNNFLTDEKEKVSFERFVFSKDDVKNIALASDGIDPVIRKELTNFEKLDFDSFLVRGASTFFEPEKELKNFVTRRSDIFGDDTTIVW